MCSAAIDRRRSLTLLMGLATTLLPARMARAAGESESRPGGPAYSPAEIPMFKDAAKARSETIKRLMIQGDITPPVSADEIVRILSHLAPQFWIGPAAGGDARSGATRFGGAPDLPQGMGWPLRPIPDDAEKKIEELTTHSGWIARHVGRALPFEFLAQIDLSESASHAAALGLPDHGRLLFFWDGVLGLAFEGPKACQVIWDRSPVEALARPPVPQVMAELEAAYDPSGTYKKPYVYPSRAMRLEPILHLPHAHTCEMLADELLADRVSELSFTLSYGQLLRGDTLMHKRSDSGARRQRLMGTPDPEQRDPRLHVIDKSDFPPGSWSAQTARLAMQRGREWQLLLQLDLGNLTQHDLVEGTVYFLIRRDDLARRNFANVHAVHQST